MSGRAAFLHHLGMQGDPLTLTDSFRHVTLTPDLTVHAAQSRLTPSPGLNTHGLLSGTLITPVGLMQFGLQEREEKFSRTLFTHLTLTNAATLSTRRAALRSTQLVYTEPYSSSGLPLYAQRLDQQPLTHAQASELLHVRTLSAAALITPAARHALRTRTLQARLDSALAEEHTLTAQAARWQTIIDHGGHP